MGTQKSGSRSVNDEPHYSPSLVHRHLMDRIRASSGWSGGDLKPWQQKLRRRVKALIGYPNEKRVPLRARSIWKRDHPLGTIEKIIYTSEPFADVMAFLCIPKEVPKPYPFFVCLQGHTTGAHHSIAVERDENEKPMEVAGDRDFGLGCMARGIAALCIEQRSFGERRERHQTKISDHGCHDAAMHALMLGRTLLAERVFDVERGLAYLKTRNDVDWKRVGVMGNSGGGTVSVFSAALLPEIRYAMPSCYFCTFRDSIMSIYHCCDNYVPGLLKVAEMSDVLGLFAPKPVVVVAGETDPIFPVKAVRASFNKLKSIYRAAGAENHCHLVIGPEGHRFYADLAWKKMLPELGK